MSEEDFYAFTFGNAVKLWSTLNPEFFKGTAVEGAVDRVLNTGTQTKPASAG